MSAPPTHGTAPTDAARSQPETVSDSAFLLWGVAVLAALAALASRAVEPALPGVWVGIDHVITTVKLGGALASQLFAVVSSAVVIGLTLATVRSTRLPTYLRAYSVGAGALVIIAVMVASAQKLPEGATLVLAGTSSVMAMLAVRQAVRFVNLRLAALLVGVFAMGGVARIGAILLAELTTLTTSDIALYAARIAATLSSVAEAAALVGAVVWIVVRQPAERGSVLRWIGLGVVIVGTAAVVYFAGRGRDAEVAGADVFLARAMTELLHHPEPFLPWPVRVALEAAGWWLTVVTLVLTPRTRLMSAAVAFALVARTTLEVPLCAMALSIAGSCLMHHPGPTFLDALAPKGPEPSPKGPPA